MNSRLASMRSEERRRNPIPGPQPRLPGQFLSARIRALVDGAEVYYICPLMLWTVAVTQSVYYFSATRPEPLFWVVVAIVVTMYCGVKIWKVRAIKRQLELGLQGEQYLGRFLEEELLPHGYHVVHDIQAEGFNVDHVVVGPTGIFTIECKMRSKMGNGEHKVTYDGSKVLVDGKSPDRDPVGQAKGQERWLTHHLKQFLSRPLPVQPIVIFPTWFVTRQPKNADVWVLNEKAAVSFILHHQGELSTESIALVVDFLKRTSV